MDNLFGSLVLYRYGSVGNEINGDCALSVDGRQFVGTFATSHHNPRNALVNDITTTPSSNLLTLSS